MASDDAQYWPGRKLSHRNCRGASQPPREPAPTQSRPCALPRRAPDMPASLAVRATRARLQSLEGRQRSHADGSRSYLVSSSRRAVLATPSRVCVDGWNVGLDPRGGEIGLSACPSSVSEGVDTVHIGSGASGDKSGAEEGLVSLDVDCVAGGRYLFRYAHGDSIWGGCSLVTVPPLNVSSVCIVDG